MSYDIIYNKQFVKLRRTGEVIPMILAGPSNCFEIGVGGRNGRRARSWDNLRYYNRKGKLSERPNTILAKLDTELRSHIRRHNGKTQYYDKTKPAEIRDHFGYYASIVVGSGHCGDTSWDRYRGVFANGIKKALTIEELDALGVNLYFYAFHHNGDSPDGEPQTVYLKTELEYFEELKKWREWQAISGKRCYLSFTPHDTDTVLRRLHSGNHKEPRGKTKVEQDHYFVLSGPDGNLVRYTSRGFRYSYSQTGGKQFRTEDEAEKYRCRLVENKRYKADTWRVKRVDSPTTFWI